MSDSKSKAAEMEAEDNFSMKTNTSFLPTMKYNKDPDWNKVRMNIIGMLNAFQPTVVDNSEQVKAQCINIIEDELADAQATYTQLQENGLTATSIDCEGYIRACKTILSRIKEWV